MRRNQGNHEQLTCDYCGAVKQEISFCIGAARKPEWTMVYGTGKLTCPACYDKAMAEGRATIDKHVATNDELY
jgi:hypothetical protein